MILREAYPKVGVRDGNGEVKMPTNQAVFRAMAAAAIDGNRIAQHLWTQMVRRAEREETEAYGAYMGEAMEYKLNGTKALRERGPGALPEDLYPHPGDVLVDSRTGRAEIKGAMSAEEQREVDVVLAVRTMHQEEYTRCETRTDDHDRRAGARGVDRAADTGGDLVRGLQRAAGRAVAGWVGGCGGGVIVGAQLKVSVSRSCGRLIWNGILAVRVDRRVKLRIFDLPDIGRRHGQTTSACPRRHAYAMRQFPPPHW
jgi:hypothetical protein